MAELKSKVSPVSTNIFLFQSNPDEWELRRYLKPGETGRWTANRYRNQMQPGQLVLLWEARGRQEEEVRGLYGWGITTSPVDVNEKPPRIDVAYIERWIHPRDADLAVQKKEAPPEEYIAPVPASEVFSLPSWEGHRLNKIAQGANFIISFEQLEELCREIIQPWSSDSQLPGTLERLQAGETLDVKAFEPRTVLMNTPPPRIEEKEPKRGDEVPKIDDKVEWHADSPLLTETKDLLDRKPLAKALASRLKSQYAKDPGSSFLIHIDGPWGIGKSTFLDFLEGELNPKGKGRPAGWTIVKFNAWQQQRTGPPWWSLLVALRQKVNRDLSWWRRPLLRLSECFQRVFKLAGAWRILAVALLIALVVVLVIVIPGGLTMDSARNFIALVAAALALLGTLWAGSKLVCKFLLWDSARGAKSYEQTNEDSMTTVRLHFHWLIKKIAKPIVFFIDDLDRCKAEYVVSMLEDIQTLIRDISLIPQKERLPGPYFVVAADGAWIRRSFESKYSTFKGAVDEPGKSLGYLFLAKLFQISVPMPVLNPIMKYNFLNSLLLVQPEEAEAEGTSQAEERIEQSTTEAEVVEVLQSASQTVRFKLAGKAIDKLTSHSIEKTTEHHMQRFSPLLEPNPRAMIRFLNAYSIARSIHTLQTNPVGMDPLALWTILKMRWPDLADYLQTSPGTIQYVGNSLPVPDNVPKEISSLLGYPELSQLVQFPHGGPLTEKLINSCCGLGSDEVRQNQQR
jgi:hypothetical protein